MGKKITLEEMKKIEVDIMKQIDKICRENNLKYSLMDGSLIGAVRHNGFIPWDDDIDVMMPRPDFEKLKQILLKDETSNIKYMDCSTQKDCYYVFGKVIDKRTILKEKDVYAVKGFGVYVDIFPIDGLPDLENKRKKLMKKVGKLRTLRKYAIHTHLSKENFITNILFKIISIPIKIYGFRRINKKAYKLIQTYDYDKSNYATLIYNDISINKHKYYKKSFFNKTHYVKFEDTEFAILDNYDRYLKDLFGNYMKLPPEDKRISNHSFDILEWGVEENE